MKRTINTKAFFNLAASSLILGVTMVGCSGTAMQGHPALVSNKQGAGDAAKAEKALADRDVADAMTAAEAAVAAQPDSAGYRSLLARAYFADGRFRSAETAFQDAMTLGNSDARTIVSLALAKVALGKANEAHSLLADHIDSLPAADYGLAMAMAGDPQEGVRVLARAVQEPGADAQTRQNFAYALALAGNWRDARLMAGQDLDPEAATRRIVTWAQTAEPSAAPQRVAALIGTTARFDDSGVPARLALAAPVAPQALAEASVPQASAPETAPAAAADAAPAAPVAIAAADIQPAAEAAPDAEQAAAPTISAPTAPARVPALAQSVTFVREVAQPLVRHAALIRPVPDAQASQWVVQLGAYDSVAVAKDSWSRMVRSHSALAGYTVLNSSATVNGQLFHRVAIKGFGNRAAADAMCRSIRARKGQCFVRAAAPDAAPINYAAAPRRQQIASR